MIYIKSPKSSEFATFLTNSGLQSLNIFISLCFNIYSIEI